MNTCDNCIHWKQSAVHRGEQWNLLGECDSPKWLRGYYVEDKEISADCILVEDDEGWAFETGPKFGCIHWQAGSATESR